MGRDDAHLVGMIIGLIAIGLVVLSWALFHFIAWKYARAMQHRYRALTGLFDWNVLSRLKPNEHYTQEGHFSLLLAEWQAASIQPMEATRGEWLPGFQIEDRRFGGKSAGTVS